jgi:WD40 repeat protein/uncharacterized caspase-like protein
VSSVAFSPDGQLVASGSWDNTIKLWEVASGMQLRSLAGHAAPIRSVVFSPDGQLLASASNDKTIKLWDPKTGKQLRSLEAHVREVLSIALSPDGKLLASASNDKMINLWDPQTGKQLRSFSGHAGPVTSVAFSADGQLLASASDDKTIKLWDVVNGTQLRSLEGHSKTVNLVAFSPYGKVIGSASADETIRQWDAATGKQLSSIEVTGAGSEVSVAFSPDWTVIAIAGADKTILVDVQTGKQLSSIKGTAVAFSPDGKVIASGRQIIAEDIKDFDYGIKLWDVASGKLINSLASNAYPVHSIALSRDGKLLASGSNDAIKLWDVASGMQLRSFVGYTHGVYSVAFSPDGKVIAGGSFFTIKLWDVASGTQLRSLGVRGLAKSLAFSPDGKVIASSSADKTILWDVASGTQLRSLEGHVWPLITSVAFSPNGKVIASGGDDKTILWDVASGAKLWEGDSFLTNCVTFSPDGKLLAIASSAGPKTLELWDVMSGAQVRSFEGHSGSVKSVAFSPDGKLLASCGMDSTVKLWDLASGTQLRSLEGHSSEVSSIAFDPHGKLLLSGSEDATMKLWSVSDGRMLASLISLDQHDWVVVTPDGLFDGSQAAWKQIIWRFNNNTSNYAPVEAFFSDFYYPGLLADIVAGKNPKAPSDISEKDRRQPELKLTLADLQSNKLLTTRNLIVKIDVSQAPAGAQDVRLFRNDSLVKVWHGDVLNGKSSVNLEETIPIVAGENRLTAYAFNHDNIKSRDVTLVVNGAQELKRKGTLYVLAIGINKYRSKSKDLNFAIPDVDEISKQVKAYQDKLGNYARTEIVFLTDQEATKANIMLALRRFAEGEQVRIQPDTPVAWKADLEKVKAIEPEDAVVIYYAGHGIAFGEHFYLLPHDFSARTEVQLKESSVSDAELNEVLERVGAGKLLMVIDACQSGQALGGEKEGRGPMNSKGLAQLAYDKGMYILTAAQSFQAAKEVSRSQTGKEIKHGLLTFVLLEGLNKARTDGEGRITEREWMNYAVDQVPLMEMEEMKKRNIEIRQGGGRGQRSSELVFVPGDNDKVDPEKRNVQRPRVFYRREVESNPLIIAKP